MRVRSFPKSRLLFICLLLIALYLFHYYTRLDSAIKVNAEKIDAFLSNEGLLQMLLINRHQGTSDDFSYVASKLDLKYSVIDPADFLVEKSSMQTYQQNSATSLQMRPYAIKFCKLFSLIIVFDINTDARFLMDAVNDGVCESRLIIVTTNRFDFGLFYSSHRERRIYYALVKKLARHPNVVFIANNHYEKAYVDSLVDAHVPYTVILPMGYSSLNAIEVPANASTRCVFQSHWEIEAFASEMKSSGISFDVLPKNYGGPKTLAKYKCFISLAYQTYENLANGVVTVVPSKRFFTANFMLRIWAYGLGMLRGAAYRVANWADLVDYWHKDLKDLFITFDSMQELKEIVGRKPEEFETKRREGIVHWESVRTKGLAKWRQILLDNL